MFNSNYATPFIKIESIHELAIAPAVTAVLLADREIKQPDIERHSACGHKHKA